MPETSNAREAILQRIRNANQQYSAATRDAEYQAVERSYQQTTCKDFASIIHVFIERLCEYDAHVVETDEGNLASAIAQILSERNQNSAAVADAFSLSNLPEGFRWQRESALSMAEMSEVETAISGCDVAIAHTGTIIIKGMRQLTLLPDRYLCIVQANQIVETVPEAIARLGNIATEALTFISGPSATADIEMTRIRGVHGPRFLDVIIVGN